MNMDKIRLTVETEPKAKKQLLEFLGAICMGEYPKENVYRSLYFYEMLRFLVSDDYDISCYRAFAFVESVFNDYCNMMIQKSKNIGE